MGLSFYFEPKHRYKMRNAKGNSFIGVTLTHVKRDVLSMVSHDHIPRSEPQHIHIFETRYLCRYRLT